MSQKGVIIWKGGGLRGKGHLEGADLVWGYLNEGTLRMSRNRCLSIWLFLFQGEKSNFRFHLRMVLGS